MFYVYVIKSILKNYRYVGLCKDWKKRIERHQNGWERTTKPYTPFKVLLIERFTTRLQAREREKYLKSGVGKEWIKHQFE